MKIKLNCAIKSFVLLTFFVSSISISLVHAGEMVVPLMPTPGTMVNLSNVYSPAFLNGMVIHQDNALQFDFMIHKGDGNLDLPQKNEEYTKLVKYFLASLTIPDQDQWVNLSPYEHDRIIKDNFGRTEMGRDLLAQDYLLKQITASLMYPEQGLGKDFWNKIYERANQEFGNTQVPVNTFNKVWIVPDEALVYESGNTAYIVKSHLKVMLEEDYLSLAKHSAITDQPNQAHAISSKMIREIILPALEKEVNEGKNFAQLRQIFSGMVLATWYKKALKESLLGKVYADKAKVIGVNQDPANNEKIYDQYLTAFKKGVYNYIKEDVDRYTSQIIPRKYFSGGFMPNPRATRVQRVAMLDMASVAMPSALQTDLAMINMNPASGFPDINLDDRRSRPRSNVLAILTDGKYTTVAWDQFKANSIRIQSADKQWTLYPESSGAVRVISNQGKFFEILQGKSKTFSDQFSILAGVKGVTIKDGTLIRPAFLKTLKAVHPEESATTQALLAALVTADLLDATGFDENKQEVTAKLSTKALGILFIPLPSVMDTEDVEKISKEVHLLIEAKIYFGPVWDVLVKGVLPQPSAKGTIVKVSNAAMTSDEGNRVVSELIQSIEESVRKSQLAPRLDYITLTNIKNLVLPVVGDDQIKRLRDVIIQAYMPDLTVTILKNLGLPIDADAAMRVTPNGAIESANVKPYKFPPIVDLNQDVIFPGSRDIRKVFPETTGISDAIIKEARKKIELTSSRDVSLTTVGNVDVPMDQVRGPENTPESAAAFYEVHKQMINPVVVELIKSIQRLNPEYTRMTPQGIVLLLSSNQKNELIRGLIAADPKGLSETMAYLGLDTYVRTFGIDAAMNVKASLKELLVRSSNAHSTITHGNRTFDDLPPVNKPSKAITARDGGIDLNSANLNFQIKRDGKGVPLPLSQQDMSMLNSIEGFIPTIIEIRPVTTLPMFHQ